MSGYFDSGCALAQHDKVGVLPNMTSSSTHTSMTMGPHPFKLMKTKALNYVIQNKEVMGYEISDGHKLSKNRRKFLLLYL